MDLIIRLRKMLVISATEGFGIEERAPDHRCVLHLSMTILRFNRRWSRVGLRIPLHNGVRRCELWSLSYRYL